MGIKALIYSPRFLPPTLIELYLRNPRSDHIFIYRLCYIVIIIVHLPIATAANQPSSIYKIKSLAESCHELKVDNCHIHAA